MRAQVQLTRMAMGWYELRLLAINGVIRIIPRLTFLQAQGILVRLGNYVFVRGL